MEWDIYMHEKALKARVIGFIASIVLTLAAFLVIIRPQLFKLDPKMAVLVIVNLAILQAIVQSVFFLNIFGERGTRWNLVVFGSTLSIIFIIVAFSIWIMHHLNYNMMP